LRLDVIKRRGDRRPARRLSGRRVIAVPQPGPEAGAANRLRFPDAR
jgi:hypothetical protein